MWTSPFLEMAKSLSGSKLSLVSINGGIVFIKAVLNLAPKPRCI